MLDVLAVVSAGFNLLLGLLMAWGLSEMGNAGRPVMSAFAGLFMVSTAATLYAVTRALEHPSTAWLTVTVAPPLIMLALLAVDRSALWGNFPPCRPQRVVQPMMAVAVFALPAILTQAGA